MKTYTYNNKIITKNDNVLVIEKNEINYFVLGRTSGTTATNGTVVFSATEDIDVTSDGDVTIVSITRANDSIYRRHTVLISCTNDGSGYINIDKDSAYKIISFGNFGWSYDFTFTNFYAGNDNTAPILYWDLNQIPRNCLKINQYIQYSNILQIKGTKKLPDSLTVIRLWGYDLKINWNYIGSLPKDLRRIDLRATDINWIYDGALPTNLIEIILVDNNNINWTYNGALPTNLIEITLVDNNNINWTYNGALPVGATKIILNGTNINWTYEGALPTNLTNISFRGENINWTYEGALPTGANIVSLNGNNINWTYSGNISANYSSIQLSGTNINWTYDGALSTNLFSLLLNGDNIDWSYDGALPTKLTSLILNGNKINWTDFNLGDSISPKSFYTYFSLNNFRLSAMTITELLILLENIDNNTIILPTIVYVGDYDNNPTTDDIKNATPLSGGTNTEKARYWINQILGHLNNPPPTKSLILNSTEITL